MKCTAPILRVAMALLFAAGTLLVMPASAEPRTGEADVAELPRLGEAPEWKLRRLDGEWLRSSDLAGKVVVVDFWATWCAPCREEIPGYIAMQRELAEQGVVVVGISLDNRRPRFVRAFGEELGINYELVMGSDAVVRAFGGVEVIPTTFLIDRDGQIRHRKVGVMHREDYEPLVRSLL